MKEDNVMINVVIIGCGGIAGFRHIPALSNNPSAALYGFFDGTPGRAVEKAKEFGGKAFDSLDAALADPAVEAVVICTPTRSHCDLAVSALEAGKHVLCEKPMAVSAKDARKMIAASKKANKKLMISHNQRRYEPHIKAKELLDRGEIGRLLTFRTFLGIKGPEYVSVDGINNAYFSKAMSGRGVMSDVGSHRIDLMHYIVGSRYKRVLSYTPTLAKVKLDGTSIEVDDNAMSIVEMENGVVGLIVNSWTSMSNNDRITQFFGTNGVITLYREDHPVVVEYIDGTVAYYDFPENPEQSVTQLTDIDELFIRCIEEDTEPIVTGEDGLEVVLTLDAIEESNAAGAWAEIRR